MNIQDLKPTDCISCQTEPEAEAICKLIYPNDVQKHTYYSQRWVQFKENTCYRPATEGVQHIEIYFREAYTIYPASLFLTSEKECIGCKLKEECKQYEAAAMLIAKVSQWAKNDKYNFTPNSMSANALRAAGVLELWCDKVYREEYSVGDKICLKDEDGIVYEVRSVEEHKVYTKGYNMPFALTEIRPATPAEIEASKETVVYRNVYTTGEGNNTYSNIEACKADAPPYALAILSFTTRNGKTDIDIVHRY